MTLSMTNLESILAEWGIQARATTSGEYKARCPMHYARTGKMDRKPSWSINGETGMHHCFSCGYSGTLVELAVDVTDMDPWSALRWLRAQGMATLDEVYRSIIEARSEEPEPLTNLAPTAQEQWMLFGRPPRSARKSRSITKAGVLQFNVRWTSDKEWALPITSWRGSFMGYQLKRGSFVSNKPTGVQKSQTLFGIDTFAAGETVVLVESPLDVVRLWEMGYEAVASFGAIVSTAQLDLLQMFTDRIIVALDLDSAGRQQSRRLYYRLRHTVPQLRYLNYRCASVRVKDVGEMPDEDIVACVDNAVMASEALSLGLIASKKEMPDVRQPTQGDGRARRAGASAATTRTGRRAAQAGAQRGNAHRRSSGQR